jgi:hypothetical protein
MQEHDVCRRGLTTLALTGLLAYGSSACLAPGPPPSIRWFSASADRPVTELGTSATAHVSAPQESDGVNGDGEPSAGDDGASRGSLRLRRVTAARHLGERIAWRQGTEYGFQELARWTELPDAVVARGLERALFESGAYVRDGRAELALDVEVRAFEEVRPGPGGGSRMARVELALLLSGVGDRALLDRTLAAEVPLAADGSEALAEAIRVAIADVTEATVTLVSTAALGP